VGIATNKHGIYEGAIVGTSTSPTEEIEQFRAIIVSFVGSCLVRYRDLPFSRHREGPQLPTTLLATHGEGQRRPNQRTFQRGGRSIRTKPQRLGNKECYGR
jgi:hypothetical protein